MISRICFTLFLAVAVLIAILCVVLFGCGLTWLFGVKIAALLVVGMTIVLAWATSGPSK